MRVDGSLMGIDDKSAALIPEWKRGHFSLLFDGSATPATVLLLDHKKQTVVDLQSEKKRHRPDLDTEARSYQCPAKCHCCGMGAEACSSLLYSKGIARDYTVLWFAFLLLGNTVVSQKWALHCRKNCCDWQGILWREAERCKVSMHEVVHAMQRLP